MKILHTSDWHLGQSLLFQQRDEEHACFLNWLIDIINKESIECLIHTGDVFDVGNPANSSRELYFSFLAKLQTTLCKTTIIISGNHDSPAMLNHSSSLLAKLQIFIISSAQNSIPYIEIKNSEKVTEAICCPIPYLRDQELQLYQQDESIEDTKERLRVSIEKFYIDSFQKCKHFSENGIPIITTGHLVAHSGEFSDSQSERPIHLQNYGVLHTSNLPIGFSYLALGHLHKPQQIHGGVLTRYAGSPIPLSFQEVTYKHSVTILNIEGSKLTTSLIHIPRFRSMFRISLENTNHFETKLSEVLNATENNLSPSWIELEIVDQFITDNFRIEAQIIANRHDCLILKFVNKSSSVKSKGTFINVSENIDQFTEEEIFHKALAITTQTFTENQRNELLNIFNEAFEQFRNMETEKEL